jgi:hypothetical protein
MAEEVIVETGLGTESRPIRVGISEYKGEVRMDIRQWYHGDDDQLRRTKKGVSFPFSADATNNLTEAIHKAVSEYEK